MEDMQQKLNSILNDPEMMQKIMTMAQALGQSQGQGQSQEQPREEAPKPAPPPQQASMPSMPSMPPIDPMMLQRIAGIAEQSGIDNNPQALLRALRPYLSRERIIKLEKAMRAAKIAGVASSVLAGSGSQLSFGR